MKQATYYTYLGDKGTITTYLQIPGAFSVKKIMLAADEGKKLTKDGKHFTSLVLVPETEVSLWSEIDA
jgi:hypothetical protein